MAEWQRARNKLLPDRCQTDAFACCCVLRAHCHPAILPSYYPATLPKTDASACCCVCAGSTRVAARGRAGGEDGGRVATHSPCSNYRLPSMSVARIISDVYQVRVAAAGYGGAGGGGGREGCYNCGQVRVSEPRHCAVSVPLYAVQTLPPHSTSAACSMRV